MRTVPIPLSLLLAVIAGFAPAAHAQVDTSGWACKLCPFEDGLDVRTDTSAGVVTDDDYKHGDYTGLKDDGAFVSVDGRVAHEGEGARYWEIEGADIGLAPLLRAGIGRQGKWDAWLSYEELPHYLYDTARTPLSGRERQELPQDWVRAGSTAGMTALSESLRDVGIKSERDTVGLGGRYIQSGRLSYTLDMRHEKRDGRRIRGGAFVGNSTLLAEPIDYETNEVDAAVTYVGDAWQAELAFYGSYFQNKDWSLTWENPFTAVAPGADAGRAGMTPDNRFNQVTLGGAFRLHSTTSASGSVAVGRMEQDDAFLPFTVNPDLDAGPVPGGSLDGEVDTTHADIRIVSNPVPALRLTADYRYDKRDNSTSQTNYDYVESDAFFARPRVNVPYGFERYDIGLKAEVRSPGGVRSAVGAKRETAERDFQEVDSTDDDRVWASFRYDPGERVSLRLEGYLSERDGGTYKQLTAEDAQNPLLRKYNMADRDRDAIEGDFDFRVSDRVRFGVTGEYAEDDYDDTVIGLTKSEFRSATLNGSFALPKDIGLQVLLSRYKYDTNQAGSGQFSTPDWFAQHEDVVDTALMNLQAPGLIGKVDLELSYVYSESKGDVDLTTAGGPSAFPDLESQLHRVELSLRYRLRDNLDLSGGWHYERLRTDNWNLDGVDPDTIASVLALGEESYSYDASVVFLSVSYRMMRE